MERTKPQVSQEGPLIVVKHADGSVVRTHKADSSYYETVEVFNQRTGERILVNPLTTWEFHGAPCEVASLKIGGHGYERER